MTQRFCLTCAEIARLFQHTVCAWAHCHHDEGETKAVVVENRRTKGRIANLREELEDVKAANDQLADEVHGFEAENADLSEENGNLRDNINELQAENDGLQDENDQLAGEVNGLLRENNELIEEIHALSISLETYTSTSVADYHKLSQEETERIKNLKEEEQ